MSSEPRHARKYGSGQLEAMLAKRYPAPEYAFMVQVANGTGASARRYADALAMGLFPSRGLHLHGFEIKVNRGDWLNELKNPAKADEIAKFCDFWWIVASPGVVKYEGDFIDMFPPNWGLLEARGDVLVVKKKAPQLEPAELTRPMMAAIFRRFAESVPYLSDRYVSKEDLERLAKERAEEIAARRDTDHHRKMYENLKARVDAFEEAIGWKPLSEETWTEAKDLGLAFRLVASREILHLDHHFKYQVSALEAVLEQLNKARAAVVSLRNQRKGG